MDSKWTFGSLEYVRPDAEKIKNYFIQATEKIANANNADEIFGIIADKDEFFGESETMMQIAYIRNTLDTGDKFYEDEIEYLNNTLPELMPYGVAFSDALMSSPFRKDIEKKFGKQFFVNLELQKKSFTEKNIPLMQRESALTTEYQKIMAGCAVEFDGKTLNLYGLMKYFEDPDREVRKKAFKAYSGFYSSHEKRLEEIWDELIRIRNEMGRNLGYENFIPLGYMNQGRTDYGPDEVASFREQVRTELVPLCQKLYEAQAKRLGLDDFYSYDEERIYPDSNATPAGDDDYLLNAAVEMYHDLSPETGEFIDFMTDHGLMDLQNKPRKASTGYMTTLVKYKAPFVFSCFNGTTGDVEVLTHEMGHAFAGYMAMRTQPVSDYYGESTDIAEIHSMSMEQFAYRFAEKFFGRDADKYRFAHLQGAITFVPFGVAVDEFQHICYSKPELTPKERTYEWRKLEKKYMPWRRYDNDEFMERGGYWYHKLHIYLYPFYYINYTLTTMGAMEFKKKYAENREKAWADYMKLCRCGGSMSYIETLRHAGLSVPFESGAVKRATAFAKDILLGSI